jgi:hypothetical protein
LINAKIERNFDMTETLAGFAAEHKIRFSRDIVPLTIVARTGTQDEGAALMAFLKSAGIEAQPTTLTNGDSEITSPGVRFDDTSGNRDKLAAAGVPVQEYSKPSSFTSIVAQTDITDPDLVKKRQTDRGLAV